MITLELHLDEQTFDRAPLEALGQLGRTDEAIPILLTLTRDRQSDSWGRSAAYTSLNSLVSQMANEAGSIPETEPS